MRKSISSILGMFMVPLILVTPVTRAAQADALDGFLLQTMREQNIPGLQVAIIKDGKVVKTGHYGVADVVRAAPVTGQTVFPINSMTKAFTGVAIMQLAAQGKLNISDRISTYLPDLPKAWRSLTIKQIVTHTSGLPSILSGHLTDLIGDGTPDSAWHQVQALPMEFRPESQFKYNQTGYILLGKLIEKLSGQPFVDFIKQNVLQKVGMPMTEAAGFSEVGSTVRDRARQYFQGENGELASLQLDFPSFMRTAAGMSASADELARFVLALQQGKLLEPEQLYLLWTPAILDNGRTAGFNRLENGYALGWQVERRKRHPAVSASGGDASTIIVYPEDSLAIVVLTNLLGSMPIGFADEIAGFYVPEMKAENGWGLSDDLQALYRGMKAQGFDHAITLAGAMKKDSQVQFEVGEINDWGYSFVRRHRLEDALEVFKLNAFLFPNDANTYDSLGETYEALGNREKAMENYRKVLELKPGNKNATRHLKALQAS